MIAHPYPPRGCNPGAPPNIKEMSGSLGHKGRAENTEAVNLSPEFSTAQCWHVSMHLARAIGCNPPGRERDQAIRVWLRALRDALRGRP